MGPLRIAAPPCRPPNGGLLLQAARADMERDRNGWTSLVVLQEETPLFPPEEPDAVSEWCL